MRRSFAGLWSWSGAAPATAARRVAGALPDESEVHLLNRGALTLAYSGPELRLGPGGAACVLEGTVYELGGRRPPAEAVEPELAGLLVGGAEARLGELRGDFALIAVDARGQAAVLARDQMGGRLAVWSERESVVAFASELRFLLRLLERRPEPDRGALAHWLSISGIPGDRTLYAGVRRLEAGALLRLGAGAPRPGRYWEPRYAQPLQAGEEESAELLRGALRRAVGRRCEDAARSAVLLSGGLDSGAVAALASQQPRGRAPRRAYSAVFPLHPSVDESALIEGVTDGLGLESTRVVVRSGSVIRGALPYIRQWELPPISPNLFFWLPLLERAAREGVEVLLDGEGGDELFGLSVHLLSDRVRAGRLLSMLRVIHRVPGRPGERPPARSVLRFALAYGVKGAVPFGVQQAVRRLRGPERYAEPWLRPEMATAYFEIDDPHAWKRQPGPRWFAWLVNQTTRGMGPALAYDHIRRRAAFPGLEARHPLVDVDVVELVLRLAPEHAFNPLHSRPLLRRALAGLLPDEVRLRRAKSNFDALFHQSLAGPDLPALRALLGDAGARVAEFVEPGWLEELASGPPARAEELPAWALRAWRTATAECWLRAQEDPDALDRLLAPLLPPDDCELVPPLTGDVGS